MMNEENPNIGQQFNEIMGKNFTPEEQRDMHAKAVADRIMQIGEEVFGGYKESMQTEASRRMGLIPDSMKKLDEDGELHVSYTSPKGWTHTWHGGPYIEHHHPKAGAVDVSGVEDYETGNIPTLTEDEFKQHAHDWETEAGPDNERQYGKL